MNKQILVKDNFIPKLFFNRLKSHLLSDQIEWRFQSNATNDEIDETGEDYYFAHRAYNKLPIEFQTQHPPSVSSHFDIAEPVLYFVEDKFKFEIFDLYRMNFTLINQRVKNTVTKFHIDLEIPHFVGILYLDTCDGPTLVENDQIDCIENRMVLFDGSLKHAAVTQTNSRCRTNIICNITGNFL